MKARLHFPFTAPPCSKSPTIPLVQRLVGRALLAVVAFTIHTTQAAVIEGWVQRYNGPANRTETAGGIAVDDRGNVLVTGSSHNGTNDDFYTAKYSASGVQLWEKRYNGPGDGRDSGSGVVVDRSGNVIVTGSAHNGSGDFLSGLDYYTAKYAAADGTLIWEKRYNGAANLSDSATALALDSNDNVVVTGYSFTDDQNSVYYTAKYSATNGVLLWEKRYDAPGNGGGLPFAVAVDGAGNVVVAGYSVGDNREDYYTAKYAAADGSLIWEKRYNGPGNHYDSASGVAVDSNGNVAVTGASSETNNRFNYYTAKYAAMDGALLWEKRYTGPFNDRDTGNAVAVDSSGNVIVTGESQGDYYTAKYAAADGALLWEKRYEGPTFFSSDSAAAIAVDPNGNVVVTGKSQNDYYTAKYAAVDGALLWEKRYNGPANREDWVGRRGVVLGPNGMVAITGSSEGVFDSLTTYDYATVIYWENLPPVTIVADGAGGYFVRGSGIAGSIYELQRAISVAGPWITNSIISAVSTGLVEFHDTDAPSGPAFYRTVQR